MTAIRRLALTTTIALMWTSSARAQEPGSFAQQVAVAVAATPLTAQVTPAQDGSAPPAVAVEYSDAYRTCAKIHKVASFATLPLFGVEGDAFSMACPHENAVVKWVAKEHLFFCTKHDSEYTPDGIYTTGHATRNLDRFPVRREGSSLIVSLDRVFHSDANKTAWAAAAIDV